MDHEPTIFVVDDDASIRRTQSLVIESAGFSVKTFPSGESFLEDYSPQTPGCLVLDLRMTGMSGLDVQDELTHRGWHIPIIFSTAFGTVDVATKAMKAKAVYFLEKPVEPDSLIDRIKEAVDLDRLARQRQSEKSEVYSKLQQLTPREREVLDLVIQGKSSRQIAAELFVSVKTIQIHRSRIMTKLEAGNVADLVRITTAP